MCCSKQVKFGINAWFTNDDFGLDVIIVKIYLNFCYKKQKYLCYIKTVNILS